MSTPPPDDSDAEDSSKAKLDFTLPYAEDFPEVNKNFETLSEAISVITIAMKNHTQATNDNLTKLAEETSASLNKFSHDLKSIFSSQAIIFTICVIVVCLAFLTVKGVFDLFVKMLSW